MVQALELSVLSLLVLLIPYLVRLLLGWLGKRLNRSYHARADLAAHELHHRWVRSTHK